MGKNECFSTCFFIKYFSFHLMIFIICCKSFYFSFCVANIKQHSSGSPTSMSRLHRARHSNSTSTSHNELSAFISEEYLRHARKRSPSTDVIMDSPTHKRSRLV